MTVISLAQLNIIRSRSSAYKKEINQRQKTRKFLAIILISCIIISLFLYIFQTNGIAAEGYKIRSFKKQIRELEDENKTLQVNTSNLKSINILQSKTEDLDMVQAKSIEYVTLPLSGVVIAK